MRNTDSKQVRLFLKMSSLHLLQLGQFMYSFSTGNLPSKLEFIVTTQGTRPFFGYRRQRVEMV